MATLLQRSGTFCDFQQSRKTRLALNDQRNFSQFCDVVLRVCGNQIYAHACVLSAASPYFSSFLGMGTDCPRAFSQKQPQVIEIHIDSLMMGEGDGGYGEAVCKVVEYMYTNEITITTNICSQIIEIGRIMLLDQLLFYCEEFQKGLNGNKPKSVSTCTSTLEEVVNILNTSCKVAKRADAQTETDEILLGKITNQPVVSCIGNIPSTDFTLLLDNRTRTLTGGRLNVICEGDTVENENKFSIPGTSQIEQPLIVIKEENIELKEEEPDNVGTDEMSGAQVLIQEAEPEENFNTIKSFEDILEYDNSISVEQPAVIINEAPSSSHFIDRKLNYNEQMLVETVPQMSDPVTDVELEDISDLVTFDSVTSEAPSKNPDRGRMRKRGRGRPKGKKNFKKINDRNTDSDYEFEQLIEKLEKGGNYDSQENFEMKQEVQADTAGKSPSNMVQRKTSDEGKASMGLKKSGRIRSRPSQLRKDYILHSLRKSKRKFDETKDLTDTVLSEKLRSNQSGLLFLCQNCDFSSTVFKAYVNHLNSHPETDPKCLLCQRCGFKTTKSREFKMHKEIHMAEDLICAFCLFQATDSTEYIEHKLKHSGDLPYFCNECDSRFKKKSQLESHQPKHWLQRPFICPICKAGFKWKHALKNHMITHTAGKDHLCDICGYSTAHKSMLTSHRLIHTGETFKCTVEGCHFEGTKRQKLKMHMLTHTGEKPHQCDVCGQRFSLAKNMRRHSLLHTNTRPFACKICSFTTTRYDKLKEHNHKLHNIGGPPVPKKNQVEELVSSHVHHSPTATIVTSEDISLNPDGTISAESLQKIAELAAAQHNDGVDLSLEGTTINIEQPDSHNNSLPIIAHIQYSQPGLAEAESIEYNLEEVN